MKVRPVTDSVADANRLAGNYIPASSIEDPVAVAVADPGRRLLARLIDYVIISGVSGVMWLLVLAGTLLSDTPSVGPIIFAVLFTVALAVAYEVVLIARDGQTVGKRLMELRVVMTDTRATPSGMSSFLRFLIPNLASIVPFGGAVTYASILWGRNGQGWHDMVAKTTVVNVVGRSAR